MNPLNDKPIDPEGQDQSRGDPMNSFNDKPIKQPGEDRFGFSPFAEAIAQSIIKHKNPEGTVIAINGPWGSGKSSVINLVKHYLKKDKKPDQLQILDFKCWWFRGEEALVLEFFHQLYGALDQQGLERAKEAISQLGSRMLSTLAPLTGAVANLITPGVGGATSSSMNLLSNLIKQGKTVEELHSEISQALSDSEKRYLMIIDDIDRLSEDEVLLIFRLIKSVGRLSKITYLLAYDREVAEKIVSKRYPSEGPHYLEKIVQAPFDIPYPLRSNLKRIFIELLNELWKEPQELDYWKEYQESDYRHFWNIFRDVVEPQLQAPRDIIRIMNVLRVTWPAVAGEVDPADFLALETLRVQQPGLHATLKANERRLTGIYTINYNDKHDASEASRYEDIFVSEFQNERREVMKKALCRLFPRLRNVWEVGNAWEDTNGNTSSDREKRKLQERQMRACSNHFDTYFRFSLSQETVSMVEIRGIINNSGDENYVENACWKASTIHKNNENGSHVEKLLDELRIYAKDVPIKNARAFISGLFTAHDRVNNEIYQPYNHWKIYTLLQDLLLNRTTLDERSEIVLCAVKNRSLTLITPLAIGEYKKYCRKPEKLPETENECFMTRFDMESLCQIILRRIEKAAEDHSLIIARDLGSILLAWSLFSNSEERIKAKSWYIKMLHEDFAVDRFAKALMWKRKELGTRSDTYFLINMPEEPFNIEKLKQRAKELLNKAHPETRFYLRLKHFIDAKKE